MSGKTSAVDMATSTFTVVLVECGLNAASRTASPFSCYRNAMLRDYRGNLLVLEVIHDIHHRNKGKYEKIHSLTTRLHFRHQHLGCCLHTVIAVPS